MHNSGLIVRLYHDRIPEHKVSCFDPYLYLTPAHIATQTKDSVFSFLLFRVNVNQPLAIFQCSDETDGVWKSPAHAPFGGIQCADDCQEYELVFFLNCVKDWLVSQCSRSFKKIIIKTAPSCYNPALHLLLSLCYINTGFYTKQACLNSFIIVTETVFKSFIKLAEKRRLKRAKNTGFTTSIANEISSDLVYGFLQKCRINKDYTISLNLRQIAALREAFPKNFNVFVVRDGPQIIALTLTVTVNRSTLYNFLCAYSPDYQTFSPTVLLLECVYNYCQQEKIRILDLGISVDSEGVFKPTLHRFKQNLGAQDCEKVTYELEI